MVVSLKVKVVISGLSVLGDTMFASCDPGIVLHCTFSTSSCTNERLMKGLLQNLTKGVYSNQQQEHHNDVQSRWGPHNSQNPGEENYMTAPTCDKKS